MPGTAFWMIDNGRNGMRVGFGCPGDYDRGPATHLTLYVIGVSHLELHGVTLNGVLVFRTHFLNQVTYYVASQLKLAPRPCTLMLY